MSEFWLNKWKDKQIGFHQQDIHYFLKKYASELLSSGLNTEKNRPQVFVPLCGKSLDLIYLASLGFNVIGVELSDIACEDFFKENGLSFKKETQRTITTYISQNITILCGDIFEVDFSHFSFSLIYDRASLIALAPELRGRYVLLLKDLRVKNQIIITLEFDNKLAGPPFSISLDDVRNYYGQEFDIELIEDNELDLEVHRDKISSLKENLFYLTIKP